MPRRASYLAASSKSATTERRRRSADDRTLSEDAADTHTLPTGRSASGATSDRPILIPSDDENDQSNRSKVATSGRNARHSELKTPPRADTVLSVRSRSEVLLLPAPMTRLETRPSMPRMSQTDPEVDRLSKRSDATDQTLSLPDKFHAPCGSKSYTYRGAYNNHLVLCAKCKRIIAANAGSVEAATSTQSESSSERRGETSAGGSQANEVFREEEGAAIDPGSPTPLAAQPNTISCGDQVLFQPSAIDLHSRLLRKACASQTRKPREASVYLLRSPDLPGLVKVGMTGLITNRKANFKTRCGQLTETIDIVDLMYGAERIEELVKLDLSELNERFKCNCGRKHQEWFRIDEDRAKGILQMWVDWLEQKPYEADGQIKPIWRHLLWQSRAPVPRFKGEDHDARHAHWEKALRKPTSDELEKWDLNQQPPTRRQQEPESQRRQGVAISDGPSRLAVSATPLRFETLHTTSPTTV